MKPLWNPTQEEILQTNLWSFLQFLGKKYQIDFSDYQSLHRWSVRFPEEFWNSVAEFCKIQFSAPATTILQKNTNFLGSKWFCGAKLNFAENLLRRRDNHLALLFAAENGSRKKITYTDLFSQVTCLANYLRHLGVKIGDRVVAMLPNIPETVIAMLATTSIGAIWSSCSPDFGLDGLLDRFQQIEPSILIAADGHFYNGKSFQHTNKIAELQKQLPSLTHTIIVPYLDSNLQDASLPNSTIYHAQTFKQYDSSACSFEQLPFDHPIYILFSSGTTGKPKCMVHGAGGTLIQHLKELVLHTNLKPHDRIFFYTTCGWMMWNWLISSLAAGATVVLYEGAPFFQKNLLFDLIDELQISICGLGAKLLETAEKEGLKPSSTNALNSLSVILTTGSPLLPSSFDYVYRQIKNNLRLSSISGGSDIISCFALGNPMLPVYRGEIQCLGLGMDVKVFDEDGNAVLQKKGELVCASPFPSMPIYFWNDEGNDKYHHAYFEKFSGVWAHGDYALITEHYGMIIFGRSDATLNPGGIRVGTAEIYEQLEKLPAIADALAVGQRWQDGERIILFVKMHQESLTAELVAEIKTLIKKNVSPHHVPAKIIAVPDIPRTISGKIVELAVKQIIHQEPVKNITALANPESLEYFKNLTELET